MATTYNFTFCYDMVGTVHESQGFRYDMVSSVHESQGCRYDMVGTVCENQGCSNAATLAQHMQST